MSTRWDTLRQGQPDGRRELFIVCPTTGRAVPTGFTAVSAAVLGRTTVDRFVVQCEACGQRHTWSKAEAFFA
jgi:hypothetical protein